MQGDCRQSGLVCGLVMCMFALVCGCCRSRPSKVADLMLTASCGQHAQVEMRSAAVCWRLAAVAAAQHSTAWLLVTGTRCVGRSFCHVSTTAMCLTPVCAAAAAPLPRFSAAICCTGEGRSQVGWHWLQPWWSAEQGVISSSNHSSGLLCHHCFPGYVSTTAATRARCCRRFLAGMQAGVGWVG